MKIRPLILTPEKQAEINALVGRALAKPIPLAFAVANAMPNVDHLKLLDRKPGFERTASEHVEIPHGYFAAFSVEEQPAGLCNHLSVSVGEPGKLPGPAAVQLLAEAFGMIKPGEEFMKKGRVWMEEFEPGHEAINLVTLRDKEFRS